MSPAPRKPSPAVSQFRTLAASLARHFDAELELTGHIAALLEGQALRCAVELCEADNCTYVVRPFMAMPADVAAATAMAARILGLNAVRAAKADTCFGSDMERASYCLVRRIGLDLEPAGFVQAVEELLDLGRLVCANVDENGISIGEIPQTPLFADD